MNLGVMSWCHRLSSTYYGTGAATDKIKYGTASLPHRLSPSFYRDLTRHVNCLSLLGVAFGAWYWNMSGFQDHCKLSFKSTCQALVLNNFVVNDNEVVVLLSKDT